MVDVILGILLPGICVGLFVGVGVRYDGLMVGLYDGVRVGCISFIVGLYVALNVGDLLVRFIEGYIAGVNEEYFVGFTIGLSVVMISTL